MITRSLSRLREGAKRRSPGRGRGTRVSFPAPAGPGARVRQRREQAERVTASSNYWSATTFAGNPAFAWDVDFLTGFVGIGNKATNTLFVRAVRGGCVP